METLRDTEWDVVIAGTALPQSLLALALSRSGKRVLHVDHNDYYGGSDAALSLQDAEHWVTAVNNDSLIFSDARISQLTQDASPSSNGAPPPKLGFSRSYSLCLAPQLIYTRSALLPALVSSKVYRQLEFLAVGSWWIYSDNRKENGGAHAERSSHSTGVLTKIPGSREDVFGDKTIDLKLKRSLMKFLKLAADADAQLAIIEEWGNTSFQRFLDLQYGIPSRLQSALHALTLSPTSLDETLTSYAIPRITRHLTSIGVFGPGFGSVIPKWGGIAEVAQVACRAGAVGGGVYVLDQGIVEITKPRSDGQDTDVRYIVRLRSGEEVRSSWVAGCEQDIPMPPNINHASGSVAAARSISIVSSNLAMLFPSPADGAPPPAVALVVFAAGSLNSGPLPSNINDQPIYLVIHSSETGECPTGQCVIYSSVQTPGSLGSSFLDIAVRSVLNTAVDDDESPLVLWSLHYTQKLQSDSVEPQSGLQVVDRLICFSNPTNDLAFNDLVLRETRTAWQHIIGCEEGFMQFDDRELGAYDDEEGF